MPETRDRRSIPEVLSPEWMNDRLDGMKVDTKRWLLEVSPEDAARHAKEYNEIIKPFLKSGYKE